MNAGDLLKQLEKDPEYQRKKKQKEDELQKKDQEIKFAEIPFIADIKAHGFNDIERSSDILKFKKIDPKLTALLLTWITRLDNKHNTQEMLIRGLAVAEEPFDGRILIDLFDSSNSSLSLKWAISNTLACAKVENIAGWLEKKPTAFYLGKEHEMLVYAIGKYFNYEKSSSILKKLFPTYPLQVADVLSLIGKNSDLMFLEEGANDYKGPILTGINKSIKKLRKRLG